MEIVQDILYLDEQQRVSLNQSGGIWISNDGVHNTRLVDKIELDGHKAHIRTKWGEVSLTVDQEDVSTLATTYKVQFHFTPFAVGEYQVISLGLDFHKGNEEMWLEANRCFHWLPHIKSQKGDVAGQHSFKSPVAVVSTKADGMAVIPDINELKQDRSVGKYLDLRMKEDNQEIAPIIEYGVMGTKPHAHIFYQPSGETFIVNEQEGIGYSFYLITFQTGDTAEILNFITEFHWEHFAKPYTKDVRPQTISYRQYSRYGNDMALNHLWRQGPTKDTGGITLTTYIDENGRYGGREYPDDLWFHTWFNNMRTAMELAAFGHKDKGDAIAKCLILAAGKDGIFSTIYAPSQGGWVASSEHGGGKGLYSLPDCSWSGFWLRRYINRFGVVDGAEEFLTAFRSFLLNQQNPSGGFPCWVFVDDLSPDPRINDSASSALPIWFLGEELLADAVSGEEKEKIKEAVKKGANHLIQYVVLPQRFEDYELYYSCSKKPLDFYDDITNMYGQNTLAIQWCAEALRVTYQLTKEEKYLQNGLICLNLLSLYQQVWNPPFLNLYAFGGFGVMNTDGEWNDARQAQFAETYMNYYDMTGKPEFLERAVAATRASFALMAIEENKDICPNNYQGHPFNYEIHGASAENYAHGGKEERSHQSGFHWGTGSGLVSAAELIYRYGDFFVDTVNHTAIGINGVAVKNIILQEGKMQIEVDAVVDTEQLDVKFITEAKDESTIMLPRVKLKV